MIDERAGELFDHLPDDLLDAYLEPTALHPSFTEIAGRAAVSVLDACCMLVDDHAVCVHSRDDDSTEIVTYRHKRTVQRVVITDGAV